jgi:polyhydroxyalkanoate synthase
MEKLSEHPEKMIDLQKQHLRDVMTVVDEVRKQLRGEEHHEIILADPRDKRFSNEIWHTNPAFFFIQQIYLLNSKLLRDTLSHIRGLDKKTTHKLKFYTQHLIDAFAPTNFPLTNPDVIRETFETQGENLRQGFRNFLRDTAHGTFQMKTMDKDAFTLGKDIATTKGNIVFRNDLLELIHYAPTTKTVHEKPLLIVPPWINKFYIFDLKPENSFVKWLVDQGFTLFMISWVNPDQRHAQKTLTDYVLGGVKTALDFICQETKHPTINAIGYCTGGVLLNLLLAYLKTKGKKSIDCATLITTPFNFKEAGDLLVFVCEQQLEQLEKHVSRKGYLEGNAMVQSFNLLRANDLIWSFYVTNYLMGQEPIPFDMLYWNGDATRMPAKMHTDFLRAMYLENRLMKPGGISIDGVPIDLSHIDVPLFIMAAIEDHIAPWHSVYPLATTTQGKNKFILSGSGHVAGVFNHPNKHKYYFMEGEHLTKNANKWFNKAHKVEGSWWPTWQNWVIPFSGNRVQSLNRRPNRDLGKAPGTYVKTSGLQ